MREICGASECHIRETKLLHCSSLSQSGISPEALKSPVFWSDTHPEGFGSFGSFGFCAHDCSVWFMYHRWINHQCKTLHEKIINTPSITLTELTATQPCWLITTFMRWVKWIPRCLRGSQHLNEPVCGLWFVVVFWHISELKPENKVLELIAVEISNMLPFNFCSLMRLTRIFES